MTDKRLATLRSDLKANWPWAGGRMPPVEVTPGRADDAASNSALRDASESRRSLPDAALGPADA